MQPPYPFGGTLPGLLDHWAAATPRSPAIIWEGGTTSFISLAAGSRRLASSLLHIGVKRGDTVAVWMPNYPAWMVTFFASARPGAAVAAINTRFSAREVQDLPARNKARLLFFWPASNEIDLHASIEAMDQRRYRTSRRSS
jgi:acyl-coenzyme A synthetase/AMP-(fatty) acid ligase